MQIRLGIALLFCAGALAAQSNTYVLKAARLFDAVRGQIVSPGMVVVSDGRIQSVGAGNAPAAATAIDLGDATLLPGFIDAHTHLSDDFDPDYSGKTLLLLERPIFEQAIRATANARVTVMAGFTTVRDVGSHNFLDVGLRNSINAGIVPGPRMLVAVHAIGSMGGHCDDGDGFRYGVFGRETGPEDGVINSPDQARYAVRFNIKYGADITDAAVYPHGENALEFAFMAADGMTPAQSLMAGTSTAAGLLGLQDKVGMLKAGMLADVVAVPGNPVENIKAMQSVIFVMKDGVILRNDRAVPR